MIFCLHISTSCNHCFCFCCFGWFFFLLQCLLFSFLLLLFLCFFPCVWQVILESLATCSRLSFLHCLHNSCDKLVSCERHDIIITSLTLITLIVISVEITIKDVPWKNSNYWQHSQIIDNTINTFLNTKLPIFLCDFCPILTTERIASKWHIDDIKSVCCVQYWCRSLAMQELMITC